VRSRQPGCRPVAKGTCRAVLATGLLLALHSVGATASLAQQQPPGPARLVSFTNEPLEPQIGEVFTLNLNVRLAPDVVAFFPDTLLPSENVVSAGMVSWTITPAPADSVDVRTSYPAMGLDLGGEELPTLELWVRPASGDERPGPRAARELASTEVSGLQRLVIPIGGVLVMPHREMTEAAEAGMIPRPPADVVGGNWSLWLLAAIAAGAATLGLGLWLWLSNRGPGGGLTGVVLSPRTEALRELDRLHALGWHANGRVVEFYDGTTGALRHFAARMEADWRTALTSTELLSRLEERWGADRTAALSEAVRTAERVKFGSDRPEPEAAEADWATVRHWIEELPER
jgi:hypothetical protein